MAKSTGFWGIDIGQCALKAIRLELIDGRPTATAYDYIEHPKILSQPDADPDALTREALEKFLSRNPVGKDQVAVSIAGQSLLARFVKLPPVEEKKIGDIVKFEAKQQIPFPLDEVVWDYQKIGGGESVGGFAMETEIGLFAIKRDVIAKHLNHFQDVKADVHLVQMAPLALCNYGTYELLKKGGPDGYEGDGIPDDGNAESPRGKKRCAVVLDIGTDSSNLIITDGGKIIWQRPLPLGGNHFTRALTKEMKLTFAKAEHLKRNAAKSPDLATILKALRPVLTDFVGEVQRSLGYFTNTHRDAHVAYMVGLGNAFRLPGLQKYLGEKLSLDVRKPTKVSRVYGDSVMNDPNFQENVLTFPIAIGLALQGLELARIQTNLLPGEIRVDRLVRAKKPYAALAAACLLLGTGVVAWGLGKQYAAASDPEIEREIKASASAVAAFKAQETQIAAKKAEVDATQGDVKAIIAGNDERLNWVRLQEVLVAALPRHGTKEQGGNLHDADQLPFWSSDKGERAYQKYLQRMSEGIPLERMFDDDLTENLANINVEGVHARYAPSLTDFLTNASAYADKTFAINIADDLLPAEKEEDTNVSPPRPKPKAMEGGGWVIEVRGSTHHKDGKLFLRRSLVRNLQKFNQFAAATGEKKVPALLPGVPDPVKEKVSHVFMLAYVEVPPSQPLVGTSLVDQLMGGPKTAAPGEGPPVPGPAPMPPGPVGPPGPGGVPGAVGAPWVPLQALGSAQGGVGFPPPAVGVPPVVPPVGGPAVPAQKVKPRYEFVVCFIWREPLGPDSATPPPAAAPTPPMPVPMPKK